MFFVRTHSLGLRRWMDVKCRVMLLLLFLLLVSILWSAASANTLALTHHPFTTLSNRFFTTMQFICQTCLKVLQHFSTCFDFFCCVLRFCFFIGFFLLFFAKLQFMACMNFFFAFTYKLHIFYLLKMIFYLKTKCIGICEFKLSHTPHFCT